MVYNQPRFLPGGDKALFIEFGNAIAPELSNQVRQMLLAIRKARIPGIIEAVPTYRSLLIHYNPLQISSKELRDRLEILEQNAEDSQFPKPMMTGIPTVYGGEYGPDLEFVARYHSLTPEEVVQIHTGTAYLVHMLGFMPGFPYLGGMSMRIATPRMKTPRSKTPGGSVGIGGTETGIYTAESSGGWQIIGRTPLQLFQPHQEPPTLLQTSDYVTFVKITPQEFTRIAEEVKRGTYQVKQTLVA